MASRRRKPLLPDEEADYRELYVKENKDLSALYKRIEEKDMYIQSMQYKLSKANLEVQRSREICSKDKSTAILLRQELDEMTEDNERRNSRITLGTNELLVILSGLERHCQHGHHLVESRTTINLLLKLREGINSIAETAQSLKVEKNIGDAQNISSLETELIKVCNTLESENANLRDRIRSFQKESREKESKLSLHQLIP
jgi:hypothetical protein